MYESHQTCIIWRKSADFACLACDASGRLHPRKIWEASAHTCALLKISYSVNLLSAAGSFKTHWWYFSHMIMETREIAPLTGSVIQLALLWQMTRPILSSKAVMHHGGWVALPLALKVILWRWRSLRCVRVGLWVCVGELTWPSGSRCSSLWCTDRSVCRPGRSLWRLCEYPAGIWGHRLSLGTGTHRGRQMEKQCYSHSVLRMTMHSSCWQTQHASKDLQSLFHT